MSCAFGDTGECHDVAVLQALAEHLNRETRLEPMLHPALTRILRLVGAKSGWIFLVEEGGGFRLASAQGLPPELAKDGGATLRATPCRCQRMLRMGGLTSRCEVVPCDWVERIFQGLAGGDPSGRREPTEGLDAHVSVPLRAGGRTLGLLNVALAGNGTPDADTSAVLGLLADTLGVAIERAQLHAQLAARPEDTQILASLAQKLLGLTDVEEIAEAVFAVLRQTLHPDGLSLFVADPSGTFLESVAGWGCSEAHVDRLKLVLDPPDRNGLAWALHVRQPVVEDVTRPSPAFRAVDPAQPAGIRVRLNLPMIAAGRATGAIVVDYFTPQALGEGRLRFAERITGVAGLAVERALEHRRNRMLFEHVPVALYRSTPDGRLLDVNQAMVRMLGYPDREALLAANAVELYADPEDRVRWQRLMDKEDVVTDFEVQWRRFDGAVIWVRESARVVRDADGRPAYYEGSMEDITVRKRVESDLHYLASHDPLTGAFNRHRFQEELYRLIAQMRRTGQSGALLFIDLDNLKEINDRLGHRAGDELLQSVVRSIRGRLRETDVLARLGGDEFGVVAAPINAGQAVEMAERILDAVREQAVVIGGRPVRLTASCGIALFPQHGVTPDEVLAAADLSMYVAKDQGGDRVVLYVADPAWRSQFHIQVGWSERLRNALKENRLVAYAQPILDLQRNEVTRWEFLVRVLEGREVIPPAVFLPSAERLNLIRSIDLWMCRQALQFVARRREACVHVNLSPRTLRDDATVAQIVADLDQMGLQGTNLVVEVTETAAVADVEQTLRCLEALRSRGCRLALDDFGVGFSSLYYLRHLPVDYLKIDASFIRGLLADPQDRQIVRAIVVLAKGLGRATIAEGVQDQATLEAVRSLGVDYAQGYHIGHPVPATQL